MIMQMLRIKSQEVKKENSGFWYRMAWTPWKNIIGESDPHPYLTTYKKKKKSIFVKKNTSPQ